MAQVLECDGHGHLGGLVHLEAAGVAVLGDGALAEDLFDVDHLEGAVEPAADHLEQRRGEAGADADEGDGGVGGVGGVVADVDEFLDVGGVAGGDDGFVDERGGEAGDDEECQDELAENEGRGAAGVLAGAWVARERGGGVGGGGRSCDLICGVGGAGFGGGSGRGWCLGGGVCPVGSLGFGGGQRGEAEIVE